MTLSRRILLKNGLLVLGLLVLAGVSLLGLRGLRHDVHVALAEYQEMKTVEQMKEEMSSSIEGLHESAPDLDQVRGRIQKQIARLRRFVDMQKQDEAEQVDAQHDQREAAIARETIVRLDLAIDALRNPVDSDGRTIAAANLVQAQALLDTIADECNALIHETQTNSHRNLRMAINLVAGLAIALVIGAVLISISQYRSVMAPLGRLRQAVRIMARGDLKTSLGPERDQEFIELAKDFNHMASQLDHFYRGLEEMVEEKSRDLVRSERLASVGFLAAGVAHEINNPLNVISGQAELSLKRMGADSTTRAGDGAAGADGASTAPDAQVVRKLQIIREEAFRCKEIINRLLSLARNSGQNRQRVSLHGIADDVAFMATAIRDYQGRSLQVRIDPPDEPLDVNADANEMKQVLLNLAVNALEAVEPERGRVLITGRRDDGHVEIAVIDNGRGIAQDKLERVFEPFFTEKRGVGGPGTGLGLSITHAIIEQHGGRVTAHSDGPGQGSRFVVRLPSAEAPHEPAPLRQKSADTIMTFASSV
jgi:signal transduction histidine kinase